MTNENIRSKLAGPPADYGEGTARTISLVITEDCQLRCKYCCIHGKNKVNKMSYDTAKKSIDYILSNKEFLNDKTVIYDFMGGEALMEIDLIDNISDYIKQKMYEIGHPWLNNYRFSITTNGILYSSKKVQDFIEKNRKNISIGITIDGTQKKHDINRIYPDGSGSYDDIVKNISLWLKQFPEASTNMTVSSADLPFIKESVIHIWSLGIRYINIKVVFENPWVPGDDLILEDQLRQLADFMIDKEFYRYYYCSFFAGFIGKPMSLKENQNWCGCGKKMLAVDFNGDFYPCNRFMPFSMANKKARTIGNINSGIDFNRLRPFEALDRITQSLKECLDCEVAGGCALCVGLNYDNADTDTIYQRAIHICKMHKARVKANDYYWERLKNEKGIERE